MQFVLVLAHYEKVGWGGGMGQTLRLVNPTLGQFQKV